MKDLLRISDLTSRDLGLLLDLAEEFSEAPGESLGLLRHNTVVLYFAKPSTRTRISTETAVVRLEGTPISVGPDELQLNRGETIADTGRVLGSYAAAIVIRTYADADVQELAAATRVPVINALTDGHHPLQAIADLLTLKQRLGTLKGRTIAYVGAGNNVTNSLMEAAALAGMNVAVGVPPGYEPAGDSIAFAERETAERRRHMLLTHDPAEAVKDADAVYTDVWLSMGDSADERAARVAALTPYQLDQPLLDQASDGCVAMHCLPAHRGEEITAEVIDGDRSLVFQQAANRLPATQAVLYALLTSRVVGR
jgi:ornithine carbamoyltransferase